MLTVVMTKDFGSEVGHSVKRATGFGREGFVAEVTVKVADGLATVRAEALSAEFALMKAKLAAREKVSARKRRTGFGSEGLRETLRAADFDFGFSVAA